MPTELNPVLFLGKCDVSENTSNRFSTSGFDLVVSRGVAEINDEIARLKPEAIIIDTKFCLAQSIAPRPLLAKIQQKIKSRISDTPVLLINASGLEHLDLLRDDLVYAVFGNDTPLDSIWMALLDYRQKIKKAGRSERIRHEVSVPCLVKKLGSAGLLQGKICDLSPNGMKVIVNHQTVEWTAGDEVRFSFTRPDQKSGHFEGHGHVRWHITDEVAPGIQVTRMGLEFSPLPPTTLKEFADMLNFARGEPLTNKTSASGLG